MARAKVLLDFDGTVTTKDTVDAILERFAAPAWRDVEEEWKSGKIGSRECLSKQTAMIDANTKQIDALIDSMEIDPDFEEFLDTCSDNDVAVTIVSGGYRRSIERVLNRANRELPLRAGVLEYKGRRRWKLLSPSSRESCSSGSNTCKCAVASEIKVPTILVGDGRSDFCVSEKVDFVLAKGSLARHCAENGIEHQPITGLKDAAKFVAEFVVKTDTKRAA